MRRTQLLLYLHTKKYFRVCIVREWEYDYGNGKEMLPAFLHMYIYSCQRGRSRALDREGGRAHLILPPPPLCLKAPTWNYSWEGGLFLFLFSMGGLSSI